MLFVPCGDGDDDEALVGALGVALGVQAGQVAQQQADVVALRLRGGDERDRGAQRGGRVAQPADAAAAPAGRRRTRSSAVEHAGQARFSGGVFGSVRDAGLQRVGQHRRGGRQRGRARAAARGRRRRCCAGTGAGAGTRRVPVSSVGGLSVMKSCRNGRATPARAVKVVFRLPNSAAWVSATGATSEAVASSAGNSRSRRVRGLDRLRATGSRFVQQRLERLDRGVQVVAAAGQTGAEAVQRALRAPAGAVVEHVEHVVDLHRLGPGGARGDRGPGGEPGLGPAGRELHVLQARGPSAGAR